MDEQTFRRLAPDAVAGRLDAATYAAWKAATAEDPERAAFVVRVAEADARFGSQRAPTAAATLRAPRVPRRKVAALALVFVVLGLASGGLVMHSYLRAQQARKTSNAAWLPLNQPAPQNQPESQPAPANGPRESTPPNTGPEPDPEPEPEPQPQPTPEPQPANGLQLFRASGNVSVRDAKEREWRSLGVGEAVPAGSSVSVQGGASFRSDSLELHAAGAAQFELREAGLHFASGRVSVRVSGPSAFSCHKQAFSIASGAFVVAPRALGGDLYIVEGASDLGRAPLYVPMDGTANTSAIAPEQLLELEAELLGPHHTLLRWDFETAAGTPELCELIQPGALGIGHAGARKPGQPGVGVAASAEVFTAEAKARLRLRVKTDARRLRLELRVQLEQGYRLVDALVDLPQTEEWQTIDVPLALLRAGRHRDEPGWLEGRVYAAMLLMPAADPARPLMRRDFAVDDVQVYVPE